MEEFRPGLEGVVAFETEIAEPDREGGSLRYRGVDIEDLAGHITFGRVWGLLVDNAFTPGLAPAEPYPIPVHSGDIRVDVQSSLAMLAPAWVMRPLLDISDQQAPHVAEGDVPDQILDVHAAVAEGAPFPVGLGDLRLKRDNAFETGPEVGHLPSARLLVSDVTHSRARFRRPWWRVAHTAARSIQPRGEYLLVAVGTVIAATLVLRLHRPAAAV